LIYAYAIAVLVVALIIFLAVIVILGWADPSTPPGFTEGRRQALETRPLDPLATEGGLLG